MSQIVGTDKVKDALLINANNAIESIDDAESGHTDLDTRLDAMDALLASLSDDGYYSACTSSTRPAFASIDHGHLIGETDTGNFYLGDKDGDLGTAERWVVAPGNYYTTAGLPGAAFTILTGTKVYDTTLDTTKIWDGASWVLQFATAQFTVTGGVVAIKQATTSVAGASETATDAEAVTGTAINKTIVPANLKATCFQRVIPKTAAHSVAAAELLGNVTFTNKAAAGAVAFTLPAATVGLSATFEVRTAQYLRCTADGTDVFQYGGSSGAAGGYIRSNVIGTSWQVECREAGYWSITNRVGVIKYDE